MSYGFKRTKRRERRRRAKIGAPPLSARRVARLFGVPLWMLREPRTIR